MRSPAEARKHWAEVLRSDRFKQGTGKLEYEDKDGNVFNCCLGVLCRLYEEDGGKLDIKKENISFDYDNRTYMTVFNDQRSYLPKCVEKYVGYKESALGRLKKMVCGYVYITDLNDNRISFSEIADIIDQGLLDTVD